MSTIDRSLYPGIPDDFPIEAQSFALPGAQRKFSVVKQGERFYATGTSPQEVQEDYESMLDLANQVMAYVQKNELSTREALESFLSRESMVMQMHYGIRQRHAEWVMKRVRVLLHEAGHPAVTALPDSPSDSTSATPSQPT